MSEIESHYDEKKQNTLEERQQSRIINIKCFNNWVKAVLINEYVRRNDNVVDLCCGKGGDLIKWNKAKIFQLLGVDISSVSITQCKDRYASLDPHYKADFYAVNAFSKNFLELDYFKQNPNLFNSFDIISCQFAYHYSFETIDTATQSLRNISTLLREGGLFIATIPDSNVIFSRLKHSKTTSFGNEYYQIEFEQKDQFVKFGQRYKFFLEDAINDCPEFMVHIDTLKGLAEKNGLSLEMVLNFDKFYQQYKDKYSYLLKRMMNQSSENVAKYGNIMSNEEWEVCTLYLVLIFKKTSK